jgi:hypothetical protein
MPDPLRLPAGWEVLDEPPEGTLLVAREPAEPADPDRFRANVVVTAIGTGGLGVRDWQAGTEELLARVLDDYLVVDLERLVIDGAEGGRRLAHHAGPAGEALTMEQWFVLVDGIGHTLTATVETWRYDELADACSQIAAGWRPAHGGPRAG